MTSAKANIDALIQSQAYRSKTETAWSKVGAVYIADEFDARVVWEGYETVRLSLPGGVYTPDFHYILDNGQTVFVEIKGSKKQKGYRDARSKLRAAAAVYPFWTFCEAVGGRSGFELEVLN